jgi:hypothetical protein
MALKATFCSVRRVRKMTPADLARQLGIDDRKGAPYRPTCC